MEGGRDRGRRLKSERGQVLIVAKAMGLRTTEWEKVKVKGRGRTRRKQSSSDPDGTPSPGEGRAGQRGQLGSPRAPLAASGVGSSELPPSPVHCSFAGRRGNCLLIAEVRGRGAGRGRTGQNGSVGRAVRCLSPSPLASAARSGRQQLQRQRRPLRVASPKGSALRQRGALSARNKWPPRRLSGPPVSQLSVRPGGKQCPRC